MQNRGCHICDSLSLSAGNDMMEPYQQEVKDEQQ